MIKIGKGPKPNNIYLKNSLLKLLNLDLDNEEEIAKFCEEYNLFIIPVNSSYSSEIKKILFPLKDIVEYYVSNNNLLPEHVQNINKYLTGITFQLNKIDPKDIKAINYLLDPTLESYDYQVEQIKKPQFGFTSKHSNTVVLFWEELAKLVVRNQQIKNCACCGKFYIPSKKGHDQRYCSPFCQDRYKKKRRYYLKGKSPRCSP